MTERPIIFPDEEVRAIIEGRKTTDRQVIEGLGNKIHYGKLLGDWGLSEPPELKDGVLYWRLQTDVDDDRMFEQKCPWEVGDILWVRETWCNINKPELEPEYYYLSDCLHPWVEDYNPTEWKWEPPIHMPRKAARLFIEVKDIRVERLQEITEEDAVREGVERDRGGWKSYDIIPLGPHKGEPHPFNIVPYKSARFSFQSLWDSIKAKCGYGWGMNPWVWIVTFEVKEVPTCV